MPDTRISPIEPPFPPDIQAEFDKIMRGAPALLLFRTVARNPRVLQRWFAGSLLDRGSISLRLRELMILRTTARCGAEYEWGVHVASFGEKAQWTQEQLVSTVRGTADDPCWSEEDRCVILLADQLHSASAVEEEAWQRVSSSFSPEQLIELVMLAGAYHAVSFMVNAFGVQHESFAPRFPGVA
ncbi:MAG: carboxymuconolactone decarboxylase family protein [Luteimonas sp.]|nr:carboxymuconolactone decarboxylase family protein [Luteimonas sp.]